MGNRDEIVINDASHGFIIAQEAGTTFNPAVDQVIARVLDNEVMGGVVYTAYNPGGSVAMHMAGFCPNWISRDLIWICFDYPFNQLKVRKVFGPVPSDNTKALDMNKRFGLVHELTVEGVFEDADLIVMSMRRDQCKWLKITPRGYQRRS